MTTLPLQTLVALTVSLTTLFLYILGYTYWTRKKREYWERYEKKFRDYFFSLLLEFIETDDSERDPDNIIKKITKRTKDYSLFLRLIDDLIKILDGEQRDRLNDLIHHPVFLSFYTKKLFRGSKDHKIFACIYFQKSGEIDDRILAKLIATSRTDDLKLAYSATKALQSAKDFSVRKSSLLRFFKRNDITELMIAELLHLFDSGKVEDRPQIAKDFKQILLKDVDLIPKKMIIYYMGDQNFYGSSDFIFQFLRRLQFTRSKAPLIRALLTALSELHYEEASSYIKSLIIQDNVDNATRIAGVEALSTFGGGKNLKFLLQQLIKVKFPVRKAIIRELTLKGEKRIELLKQFIVANLNFIKQFQHQNHPPPQLQDFVKKIDSVALGIKIALIHRLTNTHV